MKTTLQHVVAAMLAAAAAAIGQALGKVAQDAIWDRWGKPPEEEYSKKKRRQKGKKK